LSAASFFCQKNRGIGCVFRKNRYLCSATVLRSPPQGADRGDQMGIGCESRTVPAAVCSCFPLRGANVCDTLLPLTSGSGRRRRRNESEDLPLRLNFVLPFLASAIRANSIALGLTKWLGICACGSRAKVANDFSAATESNGKRLRRMYGAGRRDFRRYDTPAANSAAGFFVSEYPALVERERKRICQHVCRESAVEIRTLTGALRFFRAWTRWKITYPQKCLLIYLTDVACEDAVRRRRICTNFDE